MAWFPFETCAKLRKTKRVLDSQKGYPALLADAKKWIAQHKPSLKKQELEALLPRSVHEAAWTAPDDLHIRQAWHSDPMRPFMLERRSNTLSPPLWSDNTVIVVAGQERHHPYWSEEFCRKMMQLLIHQMWLEQPGALAVCLQYVVRCRTNHQRRMVWPRQNYTADKFFDVYQRVTRTTIEKSPFRDSVTPLQGRLAAPSVGTYTIATSDITTLIKALDPRVDQHGLLLYRPAQLTAAAVKAAKASYDLPRGVDLEDHRDRVLLELRRKVAKDTKLASLRPGQIGTTADVGVQTEGGYLERRDLEIDDDDAGLLGADFSPPDDDLEFSMAESVSPPGLESYSNATQGSSLQHA
ncbi:hypothetical protein DL768_009243 [Monosporascus sp. mg162]|nr:hypothetical protein DL768_009243 [Monosporascus sp. mg162]